MELKKKLTDFLQVEDGSIAKKSMMLSGAVLATSMIGMLVGPANVEAHSDCLGNCGGSSCTCYTFEGCGHRDCGYGGGLE